MTSPVNIEAVHPIGEAFESNFVGRLPFPEEILAYGGRPGVQYAIVASSSLGTYQNQGWGLTKELNVLTVSGPSGDVAVLVLSRGTPILGADPMNGSREWFYDPVVYDQSGLVEPPLETDEADIPNAKE